PRPGRTTIYQVNPVEAWLTRPIKGLPLEPAGTLPKGRPTTIPKRRPTHLTENKGYEVHPTEVNPGEVDPSKFMYTAEPGPLESPARRPSLEAVREFCARNQMSEADADWFWNSREGNGWLNGGRPIKDWGAVLRAFHAQGYLPSQKSKRTQIARKPTVSELRNASISGSQHAGANVAFIIAARNKAAADRKAKLDSGEKA